MENILALQAMRQDTTDAAFAGASSDLSVGCCDITVITVIVTLLEGGS